jgi:hypothetical protein
MSSGMKKDQSMQKKKKMPDSIVTKLAQVTVSASSILSRPKRHDHRNDSFNRASEETELLEIG